MSEYKRKKVKKTPFEKKKKIKNEVLFEKAESRKPHKLKREKVQPEREDIQDESGEEITRFRVVEAGKKLKKERLFKLLISLAVIVAVVVAASLISPTGIIEGAGNLINSMGGGDYPVIYNGSLAADCVQVGSYYYVLNDTSVSAFNRNGKEIFTHIHGFSNPVLSVSSERALVFDQNGTTVNIYNLSGLINTCKIESNIINAAICRNGTYAVSVNGGEYTSTVFVFDKNGKNIYTWNSAKDIINNVALSSNGKKLAVSLVNASGGQAVSSVSVLEYSSANPVFNCSFGDKIVLSLNASSDGFGCVTDSAFTYFTWRKYQKTDFSVNDKLVYACRNSGNDFVVAFTRESDKSDNHIMYISSGELKCEFDYKGIITDMRYKSGRIYFVSDTRINVFDKKGKLEQSGTCDYGIKCFAVISSDKIAAVTDDSIKEITIK